jgi:hypothetical protein
VGGGSIRRRAVVAPVQLRRQAAVEAGGAAFGFDDRRRERLAAGWSRAPPGVTSPASTRRMPWTAATNSSALPIAAASGASPLNRGIAPSRVDIGPFDSAGAQGDGGVGGQPLLEAAAC